MNARFIQTGVLALATLCAAVPADADFTRFVVTADNRGAAGHAQVLQAAVDAADGPIEFVISPGDMDPLATSQAQVESVFGEGFPWIPVVGNHELEKQVDVTFLREYYKSHIHNFPKWGELFTFTGTGPPGNTDMNYSFDVGPVHIVVINNYWDGGTDPGDDIAVSGRVVPALSVWLAGDLSTSTKPFKLVFGHEPAYTRPDHQFGSTRHLGDSLDVDPTERDLFWKTLEDNGAHAYIHGHTHRYTTYRPAGSPVWQFEPSQARGLGDVDACFIIEADDQALRVHVYRSLGTSPMQHIETHTLRPDRPLPLLTARFQQGVGGYTGTVDTSVQQHLPDQNNAALAQLTCDTETSGPASVSQALLRFDGIIGSAPGRISAGAVVHRARLRLYTTDGTENNHVRFHRMLSAWSDKDTWNTLDAGVANDDVEADRYADQAIRADNRAGGYHDLDVTSSVRAWVERGRPNHGWALLPTGTDGWQGCSAEGATPPELIVEYELVAGATCRNFRQGDTNGYGGTVDTMLTEHAPDADHAATSEISIDTDDPSGTGHASVGLLRFENITGAAPQLVPPGATILSASVSIYTTNPSSGSGTANNIRWHRMLKPWRDTDTWNSLTGGVSDDDVEAARFIDGVIQTDHLSGVRHYVDVTPSLKAWVTKGQANHGWALLPTSTDGWDFQSVEGAPAPELRVVYRANQASGDGNCDGFVDSGDGAHIDWIGDGNMNIGNVDASVRLIGL